MHFDHSFVRRKEEESPKQGSKIVEVSKTNSPARGTVPVFSDIFQTDSLLRQGPALPAAVATDATPQQTCVLCNCCKRRHRRPRRIFATRSTEAINPRWLIAINFDSNRQKCMRVVLYFIHFVHVQR